MKRVPLAVLLLTAALSSAPSQTADELVTQGRQFLAARDLTNANTKFAAAVALAPLHTNGNVFWAATRLLTLAEQPAGRAFLDRLGIEATNRSVYGWTANIARDTNGVPLAPAGMSAAELTSFVRTNLLPEVIRAGTNLALVRPGYTLDLTSNETSAAAVTLDYADILVLRAILKSVEYFIYTTYSWNVDVQLAGIRSIYTNGPFNFELLFSEHTNLLRFVSQPELNQARSAFTNGASLYFAASDLLRGRTNEIYLFNFDGGSIEKEQDFRITLSNLVVSLQAVTPLQDYPGQSVYLASQFDGAHSPRSLLPQFRGSSFVLRTIDPTFGNSYFGLNPADIDNRLARWLPPMTWISQIFASPGLVGFDFPTVPARGYVVQTSSNLLAWSDAAGFISLENSFRFIDSQAPNLPRRFYRVVDRPWGALPPPPNDNFSRRIPLSGLGITADGYNANATVESGEPNAYWGATVWWSWTAPVSGLVSVKVSGPHWWFFDVNVYTGNSLPTLLPVPVVGGPDIYYDGYAFNAVAGTTYQIQVGGSSGAIRLVISAPPNLVVTSPVSGSEFYGSLNLPINATATDADGSVVRMECDADYEPLLVTSSGQLQTTWTNVGLGMHEVFVRATDNLGVSTYASIWVYVHPVNDNFANATIIPAIPATIDGSNHGAGKEMGEPSHAGGAGGASVWWRWTPTVSGPVTISAELTWQWGSPIGLLAVYTGNNVSQLTEVARGVSSYGPAQASFNAVANTTYSIAVDELWANSANIRLRLLPTRPPTVAITFPTDSLGLYGPTNLPVSVVANDPDGTIREVRLLAPYLSPSLLGIVSNAPFNFTWTNAPLGFWTLVAVATDNSGASTFSAPVHFSLVRWPPPNDNFENRTVLAGSSAFVTGWNVSASKQPNEPDHAGDPGGASVWWTWTSPFTGPVTISANVTQPYGGSYPLLAVYQGNQLADLIEVASSPGIYDTSAEVTFNAVTGANYQIAVDSQYGETGDLWLQLMNTAPPEVSIVQPTNGAVIPGPTNLTLLADARDPEGTEVTVDFYAIGTWIGRATHPPFTCVWSNLYEGTYWIIARAQDSQGAFTFSEPVSITVTLPRPANDDFANRILLSGTTSVSGSNLGATEELDEPQLAYPVRSVWWTWTAPRSGTAVISTIGSNFDTVLGVFTGSALPFLTLRAWDDDSGGNAASRVIFPVTGGETYQIVVEGFSGATGNIMLNLTSP